MLRAGLREQVQILFGVSWEYFRSGPPSRALQPVRRPSRLASVLAALAVVVSGVAPSAALGAPYDPATDPYSMSNTTNWTGAAAWWQAGYTGAGVDVAVIDTGVSPVEGLATPGKIVYGPDLSLESQVEGFRNLDTNGHGTFMAGLIAGRDSGLAQPYAAAPPSAYRGMAPDARIVSIKVGVADGGVDVSQVIAAIDWVVQNRYTNGLNIRVINLSYGTNTTQSYLVDPLAYAAEQAWRQGIVVVAAAGNSGYQKGSGAPGLANPAYNPTLMGVGGSDTMGTATPWDNQIASFSAVAANGGARKPDFVAPGAHMQGLRVPNSYLDLTHPGGILDSRYFRGSGTSQSAAVTSGAVALILQKYPAMSPDQVKAFLAENANSLSVTPRLQGNGEIDLHGMLTDAPPNTFGQWAAASLGNGSLELSRGADHVTDDGVILAGEQDIFGHPFNSVAMAALEATASSWSAGVWNGNSWSGNSWSGNSWSGNSWSTGGWY
ncbi:MAG TPA: S8 family serine peptidase [Candidatus Limnocylindria bacterium]|nr:S8 family serine peptidase [Candidatus Limnocylindria bacterium]